MKNIDGLFDENAGAYLAGRDLSAFDIPGLAARISTFFNAFDDADAPYLLTVCSRMSKRPDDVLELIRFFQKGMEGAG